MSENRHTRAADVIRRAVPGITECQRHAVQTVALLETGYGNWKAPGTGSNNWGSVHASESPPCGPNAFPYPERDKHGKPYTACFKTYPTPEAGARHIWNVFQRMPHVKALLESGYITPERQAHAMRKDGYYVAPEARYAKGLHYHGDRVHKGLGTTKAVCKRSPAVPLALLALAIGGAAWAYKTAL